MGDLFTEACETYPLFPVKLGEKYVPVDFVNTNPTRTGTGENPGRHGDRPEIDPLYSNFLSSSWSRRSLQTDSICRNVENRPSPFKIGCKFVLAMAVKNLVVHYIHLIQNLIPNC